MHQTIRLTCSLMALATALLSTQALAAKPLDLAWANARLAPYRIKLKPSRGWTPDDLRHVVDGVESMPPFLRASPRPLTLERKRRACLAGMGRYNDTCPTFSSKGDVFYLYDVPAVQGEGATRKLRALTRTERAQLVRRRSVIHALVALHDQKKKWSEQDRWRMINSWKSETSPFNDDSWAFSRYLGSRSPHMDLVTFAEEYFARPEDILKLTPDGRKRLEGFDVNLSLACQQFTKLRYLDALVSAAAPTWVGPLRGHALKQRLGRDPKRVQPKVAFGPSSQCSKFERWADMSNVEGIDLVLAAATSDRPESLYGHLLLTVRYRERQTVRCRGFDPVLPVRGDHGHRRQQDRVLRQGALWRVPVAHSAQHVPWHRPPVHAVRAAHATALRAQPEPRQLRQVMERLWEAERRIMYPYYFLSDNCASMLIDVLAPAIDDADLPAPMRFGLMPTEVLDVFAAVQNGDRGPLLVKRPETHFSSREVAASAVTRRRAKLKTLTKRLALTPKQTSALLKLDATLDQRGPQVRKKGYEAMQAALVESLTAY